MKHRNPTHQHALLALLASLSLSGCQWDSVLYESYTNAFGESGAGEFLDCPGMEYILIRDNATKNENDKTTEDGTIENGNQDNHYIKLYRSTCCTSNEDGSCKLRENALDINKYCIAFQFEKCPMTASRCMMEIFTSKPLNETVQPMPPNNIQFYCAEGVCSENTVECNVQFTWGDKPEDSINIFSCLNQLDNERCGATCPKEGIQIPVASFDDISKITNYNQYLKEENKGIDCQFGNQSSNKICQKHQDPTESPAEYICKCPEDKIECNEKCINPQTDTNYCGAKGTCNVDDIDNPNFKGTKCGENFKCIEGVCKCEDNHESCSEHESNNRYTPICIPTNLNNPASYWYPLRFDESGCKCKQNYRNEDQNDANGCETAQQRLECGKVSVDAVNCVEKYHALDDDSTTCNDQLQCEIKKCQPGYNLVDYGIILSHIEKSYLQVDDSYLNKLSKTGSGCILNSQTCCGNSCDTCDETSTCIPELSDSGEYIYYCKENHCNKDKGEHPCLGGCFTEDALKNLHITKECTCENEYDPVYEQNLLSYCQPTAKTLCKLKGENYKYCFGQCLNEIQQKDAHILPDSEICECEEGYKKIYFGITELNNLNDPNITETDNSIPGYCEKIESSNHTPYSCNGKNCYELFPYANPKDVECKKNNKDQGEKEYSCYFNQCLDGYILYKNDINNPNDYKCVKKGMNWETTYYNPQDHCNKCNNGQTCSIDCWMLGCEIVCS